MKKLSLTVFTVICALCMAFAVSLMANTNKANAETVDGVTPVLSETKYKISTDKNGMLIATGIKNYDDVYEVGYTFSGDVTAVNNSTTKYYTSIISGTNEWTVEELFEGYTGMIVWEIEYSPAVEYSYKAYAKVGDRVDDNLVETDKKVEGTTKTVDIEQCTITFEMGDGTAISPISVDYGTPVSELDNVVVTAPTGYVLDKWMLKTGESTYADFIGTEILTENITVKAVYKLDDYLNYPVYSIAYDINVGTTGETVNVTLPVELNGYNPIYTRINGTDVDADVNAGATEVTIKVENVEMGESSLIIFMYNENDELASAKIDLTKATAILSTKSEFEAYFNTNAHKTTADDTYVVLKTDVDMGGAKWEYGWPTGNASEFKGTFDGRGHKVSNLNTRRGLFTNILAGSTVKNLYVDISIVGSAAGSAICWNNAGTIENCAVVTRITAGENAVPFSGVAVVNTGTVRNCFVKFESVAWYNTPKEFNAVVGSSAGATAIGCYAVTLSPYVTALYGMVTEGLYGSDAAFFTAITSLSEADGWNNYWSIENGGLYFGENTVIANA